MSALQLSTSLQQKLELLSFRSRQRILGTRQGGHRSIRRGYGAEFSDYRQYTPGDNPRHIDWGVFGRSDKLYIKQFHEEEELSILVILDSSGSMTFGEKNSKWDLAQTIALALTFIALKNYDKVRLHVLGGATSASLFGSGALRNAALFLSKIDPSQESVHISETPLSSITKAASFVKYPGVALVISDFLFPIERLQAGVLPLRAKNMELHLLRISTEEEKSPFSPSISAYRVKDRESGIELQLRLGASEREEYQRLYNEHSRTLQDFAKGVRAELVEVMVSASVDADVLGALSRSSFII